MPLEGKAPKQCEGTRQSTPRRKQKQCGGQQKPTHAHANTSGSSRRMAKGPNNASKTHRQEAARRSQDSHAERIRQHAYPWNRDKSNAAAHKTTGSKGARFQHGRGRRLRGGRQSNDNVIKYVKTQHTLYDCYRWTSRHKPAYYLRNGRRHGGAGKH